MGELDRINIAKQRWAAEQARKANPRQGKFDKQRQHFERAPIATLTCTCNNVIRMFNKNPDVKCFRCDAVWFNINGSWEKQGETPRDALTLADYAPANLKAFLKMH